ncbi:MAG: type II secretion system protein [Akkermansiaceae bacterium]|nr:type II secretion system protein [Akkermansiaceae bacterium]MCP5546849.1 type II secretion system protein [Akkermansiaceae bacterium]
MHPSRRNPPRGFTLLEVLVCIAIIAVLATIFLTVMNRLRQSASSAVCVSKMNQISGGIMMYTQENNGRLPTSPKYNTLFTGQGPWFNRDDRRLQQPIGEYLGSPESRTWSTQGSQMTFDPTFSWPQLIKEGQVGSPSIVLNASVDIRNGEEVKRRNPWTGERLGNIVEARKFPMFTEVDQKNTNAGWKSLLPPGPIHGKYRNTMFFDFHLERVPVK